MKFRAVAALIGGRRSLVCWLAIGFLLSLLGQSQVGAQRNDDESPTLLLIMDSSGSMRADDGSGQSKIAAAMSALAGVVESLPGDARVGLRVYGHRIPNTDKARGCKDTELIAPVAPIDRSGLKDSIRSFDAKGFTPIGLSLQKGAQDLPEGGLRTIVLVSDGIDTCAPPPPCKVAKRISKQGIELRIDTVGFQVDPRARRELQCIARVAKGSYVDAESADELASRLEAISIRALRGFETSGTPVEGGATPEVAPVLGSGQFTDTLDGSEERYYAVELAEGQSVEASAALVGEVQFLGRLRAGLLNPELSMIAEDGSVAAREDVLTAAVRTETIGPSAIDPGQQEAGTYLLEVALEQGSGGREYPIELVVNVEGEEVAETETPPAGGTGPPEQAAPPSGSGGNTALLVVGGLAFGLLGLALGSIGGRMLLGGRR